MRAAVIDAWGEEPAVREVEDPPVGPDSVLVRVRAAGVNPVDWKVVDGRLAGGFRHAFPLVPGWDAAGVVEAVGPAVTRFAPGDEVWTYARKDLLQDGTYAELVAMREDAVAAKPAGLSFEEAGAVPLAALTALQLLRDGLAVREGERVVVLAASGGVGTFAVQLAKAMGCEVVGVCSAPNHELVLGLGADEAVDYRTGDVAGAIGRADAVLDLVGEAEPLARELGARLGSIIAPPEEGAYVFVRPGAADLDVLRGHVDEGRLRVVLEEVLPLDRAADALAQSRSGRTRGKLVVTP